jgi:hypothetical protein
MKNFLLIGMLVFNFVSVNGQSKFIKNVTNAVQNVTDNSGNNGGTGLTNTEITNGLREALNVGTNNATSSASKVNGFLNNPLIKIPFPPEVKIVETKARQFGMGSQVDRFVSTMNKAAEEASKQAAPVFINAIKGMTITDGLSILKGGDNAATNFLQNKTSTELSNKFTPIVRAAMNKVELTKYWAPIIKAYNKIPGVSKKNPNLEQYVTQKALEGLFKLIAQEETKIRKDPASRITDILKKVFK